MKKNIDSVRDSEVMCGTYGNQQVEIKLQDNLIGGSRGIQGNKIPKNFSDVAAMLMVLLVKINKKFCRLDNLSNL